jgi:hypothetical protein
MTSPGGAGIICPALPCPANPCPEGQMGLALFDCSCSGPCGCWQCVPAASDTGGAIAGGGVLGLSGIGGTISHGGASGSSNEVPLDHRSTSESCPSQRGPAPQFCAGGTCTDQPFPAPSTCASDSQCTTGVNGRCFPWQGLVTAGGCSYDQCFADSDCGAKTPCLCRSSSADNSANVCDVGGNCAVDSDCGPGGYCSPSMETCYSTNSEAAVEGRNFGGPNPYYCHTASDICLNDSDCAAPDAGTSALPIIYATCAYNIQSKRWECAQLTCGLP